MVINIISNRPMPAAVDNRHTINTTVIPFALSLPRLLSIHIKSARTHAVVLHSPKRWLFPFIIIRMLIPISRAKLILADVVYRKPENNIIGRFSYVCKKALLKKVDLFLLLCKDSSGLQCYYDIPKDKIDYVPFKVNTLEKILNCGTHSEEFIMSAGMSMRDYQTFIDATRELETPSVILVMEGGKNKKERYFPDGQIAHPRLNVTYLLAKNEDVWIGMMARSKVFVVSLAEDTIDSSGTGFYLIAMALRKCVVITESPATRDILQNGVNAMIVPPADPVKMREAIDLVLKNDGLRKKIAESGYNYAISLGDESKYYYRIAVKVADFISGTA